MRTNGVKVVVALLMLATLACHMTIGDTTPTLIPPSPTMTIAVPLFIKTATAVPTALSPMSLTATNCTLRADWQPYRVREGDTLIGLAAITYRSVEELAAGNCLASTDIIYAGDILLLPFVPPTPIPPATYTPAFTLDPSLPSLNQSTLTINPSWRSDTGDAVTYQRQVDVVAGPVYRADRMVLIVAPPNQPSIQLQENITPEIGLFYQYEFTASGVYSFQILVEGSGRQFEGPVFTIRYDPAYIPPEGRPNNLIFTPGTTTQDGRHQIQRGSVVTMLWSGFPANATRIDFLLIWDDGSATVAIGTDMSLSDGAAVVWPVPVEHTGTGYIQAIAGLPEGSFIYSDPAYVVIQ